MANSQSMRLRLALTLRRFPRLILMPYYGYRLIQPKFSVGVVGVVFNEERQVLLVEHVFHPRVPWGLPGGWIGNNEQPAIAIEREMREELELEVKAQTLIRAEKTDYNHLDMAYLCIAGNSIGAISYELIAYRWFDTDALPQLHRFHYEAILQAKLMLEKPHVQTR